MGRCMSWVVAESRPIPPTRWTSTIREQHWTTEVPFATARRNFPTDTDGTTSIWLAGGYASDGITPLSFDGKVLRRCGIANANSNGNAYCNPYSYSHAHSNANRYSNSYAYTYSNANCHSNSYAYAHSYANRYSNSYAYTHSNANCDSNSYSYAHSNANCHSNSYAYTHSNANRNPKRYTEVYSDTESSTHTAASPVAREIRSRKLFQPCCQRWIALCSSDWPFRRRSGTDSARITP